MQTLFHGSPILFDWFDLSTVGEGTGLKYGFGVYLTESFDSAVNYSEPREKKAHGEKTVRDESKIHPDHYVYTVEIPDLEPGNYLVSALPVDPAIVEKVEKEIKAKAPQKAIEEGKEFRKWVGTTICGTKKAEFAEEKAAAELLDHLGVFFNVWPTAQVKKELIDLSTMRKNIAVFNADRVRITGVEHIEICLGKKKWVLKECTRKEIKIQ